MVARYPASVKRTKCVNLRSPASGVRSERRVEHLLDDAGAIGNGLRLRGRRFPAAGKRLVGKNSHGWLD